MPHCVKCGCPLNIDEASRLAWKETLRDGGASTKYLRADEFGQIDATPEARDALAGEMQELKKRKREGAERQSQLSRNSVSKSDNEVIITEELPPQNRRFGQETAPVSTVRVQPADRNGQTIRIESENRHRVRYMDENGAFAESRTYDPPFTGGYREGTGSWHLAGPLPASAQIKPEKKHRFLKVLLVLVILAGLGAGGYFGYQYYISHRKPAINQNAIVTATMMDDMAAHTILIPGEEGTTIYIRELHSSYLVKDGFATVEVADHTWYDNLEGALDETMDVTLTPFLKASSGRQIPMDPVYYTITIPLSPVELESPDTTRTTVSTTMAAIRIVVRPGSHVTVNGKDYSDTVSSQTGEMTYNATVQPIGDNVFNIVVRSQYCRDNTLTVVFYRARQDIPLDLAVGTYGTTDKKIMKVSATTLPGAYVEVLTPYSDLNITDLDSTGKFTFNAIFDKIGYNTISIVASYPGKKPSQVDHEVYYLPPADEYTVKAWPLTDEGYAELLSNINVRAARSQVYVVKGVVQYTVSEKPQMVVINTSDDGKSQPVVVENFTKTKWEVGKYYRIYADAASTYGGMPLLNARYTYTK